MERRVTSAVITYLKYTRHQLACVRAGQLFRKAGFCSAALAHTDVLLRSVTGLFRLSNEYEPNYLILIKQALRFKCVIFGDSTGYSLDCSIFNSLFKTFKNNDFYNAFNSSILAFYQNKIHESSQINIYKSCAISISSWWRRLMSYGPEMSGTHHLPCHRWLWLYPSVSGNTPQLHRSGPAASACSRGCRWLLPLRAHHRSSLRFPEEGKKGNNN